MWVAYLLALTVNTTVVLAITAPFLTFLSPLILAMIVSRNSRKDKEIEWRRQDEVEARLLARQKLVDEKTDKIARQLEENTDHTNKRLRVIHGLVNSQMTDVLRSELGAIKNTVSLMEELIEAQKQNGVEPTIEQLAALKGRRVRIKELEDLLRKREDEERSV